MDFAFQTGAVGAHFKPASNLIQLLVHKFGPLHFYPLLLFLFRQRLANIDSRQTINECKEIDRR
jgi:hypothetical protein